MASRTFEVLFKIVITWDDYDYDSPKPNFLSTLTEDDAREMAEEMQDIGVAKYEFVEVREVKNAPEPPS